MLGQDDHFWLLPRIARRLFWAVTPGGIGMSIELIVVIAVVILAVGIAALRKVHTGSFAPWWWRRSE